MLVRPERLHLLGWRLLAPHAPKRRDCLARSPCGALERILVQSRTRTPPFAPHRTPIGRRRHFKSGVKTPIQMSLVGVVVSLMVDGDRVFAPLVWIAQCTTPSNTF